jgi:hypothetical protein
MLDLHVVGLDTVGGQRLAVVQRLPRMQRVVG